MSGEMRENAREKLHELKIIAITAVVVGLVMVIALGVAVFMTALHWAVPIIVLAVVIVVGGYFWFKIRKEIRRLEEHEHHRGSAA